MTMIILISCTKVHLDKTYIHARTRMLSLRFRVAFTHEKCITKENKQISNALLLVYYKIFRFDGISMIVRRPEREARPVSTTDIIQILPFYIPLSDEIQNAKFTPFRR